MILHQDGSRHEWGSCQIWDLMVTMDDATVEHYHMQFVEEEGRRSSFQGVEAVIRKYDVSARFIPIAAATAGSLPRSAAR